MELRKRHAEAANERVHDEFVALNFDIAQQLVEARAAFGLRKRNFVACNEAADGPQQLQSIGCAASEPAEKMEMHPLVRGICISTEHKAHLAWSL